MSYQYHSQKKGLYMEKQSGKLSDSETYKTGKYASPREIDWSEPEYVDGHEGEDARLERLLFGPKRKGGDNVVSRTTGSKS